MKVCERAINFIQIIDACGGVRICGWNYDNYIGSLIENDLYDIYHSEKADAVRKPMIEHTYEKCPVDNCPYLANGTMSEHMLEIDNIPEYPSELYLAYEGNCNYNCTCCTSYMNMRQARERDWSDNYEIIEKKLQPLLPNIKKISANGRGELFFSPRIMKILHDWKPASPKEEISVSLETNGSLFNEKNWAKIENLGQYNLSVAITVMSFKNDVYQYLSGTSLPVENIINNLHFVSGLRKKNIINHLEIATVLQEQNFREMPEFVHKCLEEFAPDSIRIRPVMPGGPLNRYEQWFMDVRNPYHPYFKEYKKVMSDSIFKHPKVLLWSADIDSSRGENPYQRNKQVLEYMDKFLSLNDVPGKINDLLSKNRCSQLAIYGVGRIGKQLISWLSDEQLTKITLIDNGLCGKEYRGIKIHSYEEIKNSLDSNVLMLIMIAQGAEDIKDGVYMTSKIESAYTIDKLINEL